MERPVFVYMIYMVFFALLSGAIFLTPLLAFTMDMGSAYTAFSFTCHQKLSRSLCIFSDSKGYWIGDCMPQGGQFISDPSDRLATTVMAGGLIGKKMPVCSRDVGLYLAMLIGGLAYPLTLGFGNRKVFPAIFLLAAMVPIGLDGGIQLLSEIGFLPFVYESTNMIRLITGGIAGLAAAFYAIPILVNLVCDTPDAKKANPGKPALEASGKKPQAKKG
ncbi:MAG: DUF2085 domain-containing protein [Candidatus Micrarchaeia archaeon]